MLLIRSSLVAPLLLAVSGLAQADCANPQSRDEAAGCAAQELGAADDQLNEGYSSTLESLVRQQDKAALQQSQRAWLRKRDDICGLAPGQTTQDDWVRKLSADVPKAQCALRLTEARNQELNGYLERVNSAPPDEGGEASGPTWGDQLNPGGEVPVGAFKAFYIDRRNPRVVVASEVVPDISLKYAWAEFHKINSPDFGAYWAGRFRFDAPASRTISISLSWSKLRLIIDKKVVYRGGQVTRLPYSFTAGEHLIEVEYANNWHTTEVKVSLGDVQQLLEAGELRARLQGAAFKDAKALHAGVYESAARNTEIRVRLKKSSSPVVLLLSSYEAVRWRIENPDRVDIRAVAWGSNNPGAEVIGDVPASAMRLPLKLAPGSYSAEPKCSCTGGHFHCEHVTARQNIRDIERSTGLVLAGMTGKYSADALTLPQLELTPAALEAAEREATQTRNAKAACQRQASPNLEHVFEDADPK